jgi:hypothetical protein
LEDKLDESGALFDKAVMALNLAAMACQQWEDGGSPAPVSDTAESAYSAVIGVLESIAEDDISYMAFSAPEARRSRLAVAAWMLTLAGTDEHGQSSDLRLASKLLHFAACA